MRILFVENHGPFAKAVIELFLANHQVMVVADLRNARQLLVPGSFDLILLDYDLDDGKGVELFAHLHALSTAIPVIAVSAHADGNTALIDAGALAICAKADFRSIQSVIDLVFARHRAP